MLLLYRERCIPVHPKGFIYIPLCFYFIMTTPRSRIKKPCIYIPLCFYFIEHIAIFLYDPWSFTFHYASTLSQTKGFEEMFEKNLHSTMLLLYLAGFAVYESNNLNLHSTMLLLYQENWAYLSIGYHKFTFHYASTLSILSESWEDSLADIYIPLCFYFIKARWSTSQQRLCNLHSTMLLLYRINAEITEIINA